MLKSWLLAQAAIIKHTEKFPEKCLALELRRRKKNSARNDDDFISYSSTLWLVFVPLGSQQCSDHPANVPSSFIARSTCCYARQTSNVTQQTRETLVNTCFRRSRPEEKSFREIFPWTLFSYQKVIAKYSITDKHVLFHVLAFSALLLA